MSCDVEQSFSSYKNIPKKLKKQSFKDKIHVINCVDNMKEWQVWLFYYNFKNNLQICH